LGTVLSLATLTSMLVTIFDLIYFVPAFANEQSNYDDWREA